MQANLTHHSATRKSLDLVFPAAEVSAEFGTVLSKIAPKVKIPGFRPGKAPKDVLLGRFGQDVQREVAENLVQRHFWAAATEAGIQPISQPAVEPTELKDNAEATLRAHFDVAPEVKLPEYKGLSLTKKKRAIDEAAVAEHLEGLRQRAAKFLPVEGAAELGHFATLDIKVKPQGLKAQSFKDQVIQLHGDRPFEAEIVGMAVDTTKKFTLTVPADDSNRLVAGKPVSYEATLKDLRKRELPELGDEFAKDLGQHENLEALKAFVRQDLEAAADRDATARVQTNLLDAILDNATFEVPASMVALQLDDYCNEFAEMASRQGIDPRKINWAAYRQSRHHEAERAVRSGYLLQAIGNAEDIQVSEDEIDAEIRNLMEEHKIQQPFETFKAELNRRGTATEIKGRIRTDKIFDRLMATCTVTEELLDRAAFEQLVELERKREAGLPVARFDAGGMEGGELEGQEGGEPDAVSAAAEEVPAEESVEAKPKRAPRKKKEEAE